MSTATPAHLSALYEQDETAWLDANAALIREGKLDEVDFAHLAEFLEDMAKRDRREVKTRLTVLMAHLLKWQFQPQKRSRSWLVTLYHQRDELSDLIEHGVLRNHALDVLDIAYSRAVIQAAAETELPESAFPTSCPYSIDALLTVSESADDLP
ncbi:DUF29 domain-containing protein [Tautonia rosea]|uniref:DUF29 domain-containing protein n=1 Tax=Tautonia rosea TaxID=2728037 RepID=UPI0019D2248E|nr:DUF29 domain-containing protein [Tautonia rosea]